MDVIEDRLKRAAGGLSAPPFSAERFARRAVDERLVDVAYTTLETPVGELLAAVTPRGLVRLSYLDHSDAERVLSDLARRVSPRVVEAPARLDDVRRQLDAYFNARIRDFDLDVDWQLIHGFGLRVLRRTARIPYGEVATYGAIAREVGNPRAARATGNALGSNPIPIVIPCHRVVQSTGALGGYGGGVERKQLLLGLERGER